MLLRRPGEEARVEQGPGARPTGDDRQRCRHGQFAVATTGVRRAKRRRRGLPASRLQGRPRVELRRVDRLRRTVCLLSGDGAAGEAGRGFPVRVTAKLTRDGWLLFATRCSRMFAYGLLSVVLVLYLVEVGLKEWEIGLLLSLTLAGDTVISLWLTTTADRLGRRRTLMVGAILMVMAGIVFVSTGNLLLLIIAATIGVISPSGNEIGPFLSVEQAALSHIVSDERRTGVFAW